MGCLKLSYDYREGALENVSQHFLRVSSKNGYAEKNCTNLYPFGSVARRLNTPNSYFEGIGQEGKKNFGQYYKYGFQGEFAMESAETGYNDFQYRSWDPVVSRWISPDPARQFHSPYLGMGNNPINQIDPDGAFSKFGAWWRSGFRGSRIYEAGGEWGFNRGTGEYTWNSVMVNGEEQFVRSEITEFRVGQFGEGSTVAMLTQWQPNIFEQWGMSDNFVASTTYSIADGPYVSAQFFTPWRKPTHIDGQEVIGNEGSDAIVNTLSNSIGFTKLAKVPQVTAPQFSSYFKGTLSKLAPKTRGWIIRNYNKYILNKAHGRTLSTVKAAEKVTNNQEE